MDGLPLESFLALLRSRDIKLWLDGDRVRVNAPTGILSLDLQRAIVRRRAEIIAVLSADRAISPRADGYAGPHELSFAQERLWFLDQLQGPSAVYNVPVAVRIHGSLDLAALQASLDALVERHAVLRTTFSVHDGSPVQTIAAAQRLALTTLDLRTSPEIERNLKLQQALTSEARRPFHLAIGPLIRAKLVRLAEQDNVLLLTLHHIVCDGWSLAVLTTDVSAMYAAFARGDPSPLRPLPIQYVDYAAWQRERIAGAELENLVAYWRAQLGGAPLHLELPADRPPPPVASGRGDCVRFDLPDWLVDSLKTVIRREGATLFMGLLAGFGVLLQRYTGQADMLVGSAIAGRTRAELEALVGVFVNTLTFRLDLSGDPSFTELLKRVRETALGAYAHQDLPFEKLVEVLAPQRNAGHHPLVQTMLVLHNEPPAMVESADLSVEPIDVQTGTAKLDLSLSLADTPDGLQGWLEYNTDLFDRTTIERMVHHFRVLLEAAVADPTRLISELSLLDAHERRQVLDDWNATQADYPRQATLHELVEGQVDRVPEAIAVACGSQTLSYRELDQRANRLAHHLRELGVQPGDIVALSMERTPDMVVTLLGIAKAGGAYLPLDPTYPLERRAFMLEDSGARVLIADGRRDVPPGAAHIVRLDARNDQAALAACSATRPASTTSADDVAYVIYTSGSTGRPKGVQVVHRGVVNFLTSMRERPGLRASDVLLSVTTLSFDIAGLELFLPLTTGARVVLVNSAVAADGSRLLAAMHASGATVMQATPATWRLLLAAGWQATPQLRVLCGGEALSRELAAQLLERSGDVWNLYGPTETTIWSTIYQVTSVADGVIPIGRPIANTQAYVLDAHLQPVPIGVPGELYLGGDGLARGYLHQPELTAARFVRNPFDPQAGARMYRTGDVVRYRPDSNLEYLARADTQVKLRGYRIELGEIESLLEQQPTVSQAVVVVREDASGEQRLAGYVVPVEGASPSAAELRAALRDRLPAYMLPATLTIMDALPLTANGKVDRKQLPEADAATTGGHGYLAPRDDIERQLAHVWEQLLGHAPIGIRDNFFDIGGHSLLAARLVFRIQTSLGRNLPVATLLHAATIEQLADILRAPEDTGIWDPLVELQRGTSGHQPMFFVHGAFGDVLCYAELARALGPDQPSYVLQAVGLDGVRAPHDRVEEMAAEYIEQMRSVQPAGPYCLAGYSIGGTIVYEMACQLEAAGEDVPLLAIFDHPLAMGAFISQPPVPVFVARFMRNLVVNIPHWVRMIVRTERGRRRAQLYERVRLFRRAASRLVSKETPTMDQVLHDVEEMNGLEHLAEWPEYRRRVLKNQFDAMQTYRFRTYPGHLTLFRVRRQPLVSAHDPLLGWGGVIEGGIDVVDVPGSHHSMLHEPYVQVLATRLRTSLDALSPAA